MVSTENPTSWVVRFGDKLQVETDISPQGPINPRIAGIVRFDKWPIKIYAFIPLGQETRFQGMLSGRQVLIDHFVRDPDREKQGEDADPFLIVDTRPFSEAIRRKDVFIDSHDPPIISFHPLSKAEEMAEMINAFVQYCEQTPLSETTDRQPKSFSEMTVDEKATLAKNPFDLAGFRGVRLTNVSSIPEDSDYDDMFVGATRIGGLEVALKFAENNPGKLKPEDKDKLESTIQMFKAQYRHGVYILLLLNSGKPKLKDLGKQLLEYYQSSAIKGFKATEENLERERERDEGKLDRYFDKRLSLAIARSRNNGRTV